MRQFTPRQLQSYLAQARQAPLLLDVREPWEFEQCRIAGAQLVPMRQVPEAAAEWDKDREIVVICHHGIRSRHVAYYLEQLGFTQVVNLEGGVARWADEVDPDMKRY